MIYLLDNLLGPPLGSGRPLASLLFLSFRGNCHAASHGTQRVLPRCRYPFGFACFLTFFLLLSA